MVKKSLKLIIVLCVLAGVAWYFFFPMSEADKVKNTFADLSHCASKNEGEGTTSMALKVHSIIDLFADSCGLDVNYAGLTGNYSPSEISSNSARVRKLFKNLSISFHDISVEDLADKNARVICTIYVIGVMKSGKKIRETRELDVDLIKADDKWKFSSFKLIQVLEK